MFVDLNNPAVIQQIMQQSGQKKWRKCKRKQYNIFACKLSADYLFANCLEQPESYTAIMQAFKKPIVSRQEAAKNTQVAEFIKQHGFYMTDGQRIVLCGTRGELWDVKPEKFMSSYRHTDGRQITQIPENTWFEVSRAAESTPSALGICIPNTIQGVYRTSWATLTVNNPASSGHGKGDILVAPMLPNGQPDLSKCSPTNNEVFALTYDQNVGGWSNSGLINLAKIKPLTLQEVKSKYSVQSVGGNIVTYEKLAQEVIRRVNGVVDAYEGFDEDNGFVDCWIYDPSVGRTFSFCYDSSDDKAIFVEECITFTMGESRQWCSSRFKLSDRKGFEAAFNAYKKHTKAICDKFRDACKVHNLKTLYKLGNEVEESTGLGYFDKVKMLFAISAVEHAKNFFNIKKARIEDYRVHDDYKDVLAREARVGFDVTFDDHSFGLQLVRDGIYFFGWCSDKYQEDPYEVLISDSKKCTPYDTFKAVLTKLMSGNY